VVALELLERAVAGWLAGWGDSTRMWRSHEEEIRKRLFAEPLGTFPHPATPKSDLGFKVVYSNANSSLARNAEEMKSSCTVEGPRVGLGLEKSERGERNTTVGDSEETTES